MLGRLELETQVETVQKLGFVKAKCPTGVGALHLPLQGVLGVQGGPQIPVSFKPSPESTGNMVPVSLLVY